MSWLKNLTTKLDGYAKEHEAAQKVLEFAKECEPRSKAEVAVVTGASALSVGMDIADGVNIVGAVLTGAMVAGVACIGIGAYHVASDLICEKAEDVAKAHIEKLTKCN